MCLATQISISLVRSQNISQIVYTWLYSGLPVVAECLVGELSRCVCRQYRRRSGCRPGDSCGTSPRTASTCRSAPSWPAATCTDWRADCCRPPTGGRRGCRSLVALAADIQLTAGREDFSGGRVVSGMGYMAGRRGQYWKIGV